MTTCPPSRLIGGVKLILSESGAAEEVFGELAADVVVRVFAEHLLDIGAELLLEEVFDVLDRHLVVADESKEISDEAQAVVGGGALRDVVEGVGNGHSGVIQAGQLPVGIDGQNDADAQRSAVDVKRFGQFDDGSPFLTYGIHDDDEVVHVAADAPQHSRIAGLQQLVDVGTPALVLRVRFNIVDVGDGTVADIDGVLTRLRRQIQR